MWLWLEQDKEVVFREGDLQDRYLCSTAKQINDGERGTKTCINIFKCDNM